MGMVKTFYMDYCEAVHPDDEDAQDELFERLMDVKEVDGVFVFADTGEPVPTVEAMQAAIDREKGDELPQVPPDAPPAVESGRDG